MIDNHPFDETQRVRVARRIRDLLLHELGEDIDVGLLLGPAEYARAVLSLSRACGSAELSSLCIDFERMTGAGTQTPATRALNG